MSGFPLAGPPAFEDFQCELPHFPSMPALPASFYPPLDPALMPPSFPPGESSLADLTTKIDSFLSEMDTQIIIPTPSSSSSLPITSRKRMRVTRSGTKTPLPEFDEADFSAAITLSRVPSAANSLAGNLLCLPPPPPI